MVLQTVPERTRVAEWNARERQRFSSTVFDALSRQDAVVVLRDVDEIHRLGATIVSLARQLGGDARAAEVAEILRTSEIPSLEALALFHNVFRHLRDSRYISGLFSDLTGSLGLPQPILIDSGYCRMAVPKVWDAIQARKELFGLENFVPHPNEAETMLYGDMWGNAHRDIDVAHYHFQINFWFPLHDVDETRTLLLFPEAYRKEASQYGALPNREDPSSWGFGRPLQIPLRFGDTLLFHSQQFHASPSQAAGRNRFSCELRVAAACQDDNAKVYRRLFWNLGNFQSPAAASADADTRSAPLAEPRGKPPDLDAILAAPTAHALFNALFTTAEAAFAAAYVHRPDSVFADTIDLDRDSWERVIEAFEKLPSGEDLTCAFGRLLLYRKQVDAAIRVWNTLLRRTRSYFWALETGRIAAEAGMHDLAAAAFGAAEFRAGRSDIALGRYTPGMPTPRSPNHILQLIPRIAARAATAFRRRALAEKGQATRTTPTFDHSLFWPPLVVASFEHYDVLSVGIMMVALPIACAFRPENILDGVDVEGVAIGYSGDELERKVTRPVGNRLATLRPISGASVTVGEHVLLQYLNGWYAIPRRSLPVDPVSQDLVNVPGIVFLKAARTQAEAMAAFAAALAPQSR